MAQKLFDDEEAWQDRQARALELLHTWREGRLNAVTSINTLRPRFDSKLRRRFDSVPPETFFVRRFEPAYLTCWAVRGPGAQPPALWPSLS